jgi:hypothetical protein
MEQEVSGRVVDRPKIPGGVQYMEGGGLGREG